MKWLVPIVFLTLVSCTSSLKYEDHIFEDLYKLKIESSMVDMGHSDPEATTEFGNKPKEFYIKVTHTGLKEYRDFAILHHLEDDELFDEYVSATESYYENVHSNATVLSKSNKTVNNLKCTVHELTTMRDNLPVRYKIAYYLSKKNIYQIHIWTMESRIERFGEGMDIIIDSFTEL